MIGNRIGLSSGTRPTTRHESGIRPALSVSTVCSHEDLPHPNGAARRRCGNAVVGLWRQGRHRSRVGHTVARPVLSDRRGHGDGRRAEPVADRFPPARGSGDNGGTDGGEQFATIRGSNTSGSSRSRTARPGQWPDGREVDRGVEGDRHRQGHHLGRRRGHLRHLRRLGFGVVLSFPCGDWDPGQTAKHTYLLMTVGGGPVAKKTITATATVSGGHHQPVAGEQKRRRPSHPEVSDAGRSHDPSVGGPAS